MEKRLGRGLPAAMVSLFLATCASDTAPQQRWGPSIPVSSVYACVDNIVPGLIKDEIKRSEALVLYGYHGAIYSDVAMKCGVAGRQDALIYIETRVDSEINVHLAAREKSDSESEKEEMDKIARDEKIEKEEEANAGRAYYACLVKHATTLSLVSCETADVIAGAAIPPCRAERDQVLDAVTKYSGDDVAAKVLEGVDARLHSQLVFEILKARTVHAAPAPTGRVPMDAYI